jgi:hypothetical protein
MVEDNKATNIPQEDETLKMARLLKAYDLSQKIMRDFSELTAISGLIAQGCLVYLNALSKADLKARITIVESDKK